MSESNPAPAAVNSAQPAEVTPQALQTSQVPANPAPKQDPGSVPYSRFQEIVEQRKGLESTLSALVYGIVNELPEDLRDLVPNLPPAEKAAWIRNVQARGLFTQPVAAPAPANSPDAKRPGGKLPQDTSGMTPLQKMQAGYAQQ